jgi:hypothetical protein
VLGSWGGSSEGKAMMNDNLNMCLPSVCLFFICRELHDGLCFIVPLMLFTINQKSCGERLMSRTRAFHMLSMNEV